MKSAVLILIFASALSVTGCNNSSDTNPALQPDPINEGTGSEDSAPLPAPNPNPNMPLAPGQWAAELVTMFVERNNVRLQFACSVGNIVGKITPDENGRFTATGTIKYFSNQTGADEIYPAKFEGITSPDKSVIAIRIVSDDPRIEGGSQNEDFIMRKDFVPPGLACAF